MHESLGDEEYETGNKQPRPIAAMPRLCLSEYGPTKPVQPCEARQTSGGCGFKGLVNTAQRRSALPAGRNRVITALCPCYAVPSSLTCPRETGRGQHREGVSWAGLLAVVALVLPSVWSWASLVLCNSSNGTKRVLREGQSE